MMVANVRVASCGLKVRWTTRAGKEEWVVADARRMTCRVSIASGRVMAVDPQLEEVAWMFVDTEMLNLNYVLQNPVILTLT